MFDYHIPTHEAHLKSQDRRILSVVRQNKFQRIAIGEPNKSLAKAHVATFIDSDIASERFAKMRMKAFLVAAGATAPKCNWVELRRGVLRHEIEGAALEAFVHRRHRSIVVGRLAGHVPHAFS